MVEHSFYQNNDASISEVNASMVDQLQEITVGDNKTGPVEDVKLPKIDKPGPVEDFKV